MGLFILRPCCLPRPHLSLSRVQADVQEGRLTGVHRGKAAKPRLSFISLGHSFVPSQTAEAGTLLRDLNNEAPLQFPDFIALSLSDLRSPPPPPGSWRPRGTLGPTFKWLSAVLIYPQVKSVSEFWEGQTLCEIPVGHICVGNVSPCDVSPHLKCSNDCSIFSVHSESQMISPKTPDNW